MLHGASQRHIEHAHPTRLLSDDARRLDDHHRVELETLGGRRWQQGHRLAERLAAGVGEVDRRGPQCGRDVVEQRNRRDDADRRPATAPARPPRSRPRGPTRSAASVSTSGGSPAVRTDRDGRTWGAATAATGWRSRGSRRARGSRPRAPPTALSHGRAFGGDRGARAPHPSWSARPRRWPAPGRRARSSSARACAGPAGAAPSRSGPAPRPRRRGHR